MGVPTAIGPAPAMTITTNRKVNDFGAWYEFSLSDDAPLHRHGPPFEAVIQSRNCCLPGAGCRFFDTVAAGRPQRGVRDRAVPTPGDGGSAS